MKDKSARLENVTKAQEQKRKRKPSGLVVYFFDYEGTNLYDKPFHELGARLVLPEELEKAKAEKTVILVKYEKVEP